MDKWAGEVTQHASSKVVKVLVGNKSDLNAVVDSAAAGQKAEQLGMSYVEVSAKSGFQVQLMFESIVSTLINPGKVQPPIDQPHQTISEKPKTASDKAGEALSVKLLTRFLDMRISDYFQ